MRSSSFRSSGDDGDSGSVLSGPFSILSDLGFSSTIVVDEILFPSCLLFGEFLKYLAELGFETALTGDDLLSVETLDAVLGLKLAPWYCDIGYKERDIMYTKHLIYCPKINHFIHKYFFRYIIDHEVFLSSFGAITNWFSFNFKTTSNFIHFVVKLQGVLRIRFDGRSSIRRICYLVHYHIQVRMMQSVFPR